MKWHQLLLLLLMWDAAGYGSGRDVETNDFNFKHEEDGGLVPHIFNLATRARITANATCGEAAPEVYCRLVEHVPNPRINHPQCRVCDGNSAREDERHPIENAIDGTNQWWQSPSIANGMEYHWVTVTLDLGQVFQVAYVILKAANSPRPGNWVLERSADGVTYQPWQYYAVSDADCYRLYGQRAAERMEDYSHDDEVICTSYYSSLEPLRDGEIHASLINGRPSAESPSEELMEFMSARYIRLRFQRIRTLYADLMSPMYNNDHQSTDTIVSRRYFYSIKDISVGGHCICHGHARECIGQTTDSEDQPVMRCVCQHNTCGERCDECCPGYHQREWRQGVQCEACNCHNHADDCYYDPAAEGRSLDPEYLYRGGGACLNCRDNTEGLNCERCVDGYYRPEGMLPEYPNPCTECSCDPVGTIPDSLNSERLTPCVKDDSLIDIGVIPGSCACKMGYAGLNCDRCARGYRGYPTCLPCPCSAAGSINEDPCEGLCICKPNVEGPLCDQCVEGTFNLNERDLLGCTMCFCSGVTTQCTNAPLPIVQVTTMDDWLMTGSGMGEYIHPQRISTYAILADHQLIADQLANQQYYFLAPKEYLDNKLTAYGGIFQMALAWRTTYDVPASEISRKVVVILEGYNMHLARWFSRDPLKREDTISFIMNEAHWYHLPEGTTDPLGMTPGGQEVSQAEFMNALSVVTRLKVGVLQDPPQISVLLKDVSMDVAVKGEDHSAQIMRIFEECACPPTYEGLSCESCVDGYSRKDGIIYGGDCEICDCNGHSSTCDDITGECLSCEDNTYGPHCELCLPGYYGNASSYIGCLRCACPLLEASNNFSPSCVADSDGGYICDQCPPGYDGEQCERCADGYFGNPLTFGGTCQSCSVSCHGNIDESQPGNCDSLTGKCLICIGNTIGSHCERCADGYYGDAINSQCQACNCDEAGSASNDCDQESGACVCLTNVTGTLCDRCKDGFWNLASVVGCQSCDCDTAGSLDDGCDIITGQCHCREGVAGLRCDQCKVGYWGLSDEGCQVCTCDEGQCDPVTGECYCPPNTVSPACKECLPGTWRVDPLLEGCRPCNCSRLGSYGPQCNMETGQCRCRKAYTGLSCDQCPMGYTGFPGCRKCRCNTLGTDPATCEGKKCECSNDGQCLCKDNFDGLKCDRCNKGYFGLTDMNPSDCVSCFCSGVSSICSLAEYVYSKLRLNGDTVGHVYAASPRMSNITREGLKVSGPDVRMDVPHVSNLLRALDVYWKLPPPFTGSKVTSYGGSLRYKITAVGGASGSTLPSVSRSPYLIIVGSDVVLEGTVVMKERSNTELIFKIDLTEKHFVLNGSNIHPSRPQFMMALAQLQAIYIRANVFDDIQIASLSKVSIDVGIPGSPSKDNPQAIAVEQCECPVGYVGTSCEECSIGYVRISSGPYLGTCQQCECNGHAESCDEGTGACINCQDNTTGPRCEQCAPGYYGDATKGTDSDCKQCACPLTQPGNNPTCELFLDGSHNCTACPRGYTGRYCERCEDGYFGDPSIPGSSCHHCNCNGLGSVSPMCDMVSGLCHCQEGVKGDKCDECQAGFALKEEGCISCFADTCTKILLQDIASMEDSFNVTFNASSFVIIPWSQFLLLGNRSHDQSIILEDHLLDISKVEHKMPAATDLLEKRKEDVKTYLDMVRALLLETEYMTNQSSVTLQRGLGIQRNISGLIGILDGSYDELHRLLRMQEQLPVGNNGALLQEALLVLNELRGRNFENVTMDAYNEHSLAVSLYQRVVSVAYNNTHLMRTLPELTAKLSDLRDSVSELWNLTNASQNAGEIAITINNTTRPYRITLQDHDDSIVAMDESTQTNLQTAWSLINSGRMNLDTANGSLQGYFADQQQFASQLRPWMNISAALGTAVPELSVLVSNASSHSQHLWNLSASLESLLQPTRHLAENALDAARAYSDIINAINSAENASTVAKIAANDAYSKTFLRDGRTLLEGAVSLSDRAVNHLSDAFKLQGNIDLIAKNLKRAAKRIQKVDKKLNNTAKGLRNILKVLPSLEGRGFSSRAKRITELATGTINKSAMVKNRSATYVEKFQQLRDLHSRVERNTEEARNFTVRAVSEVDSTRAAMLGFDDVSSMLEDRAVQYGERESRVRGDIDDLRTRIRMAKNEASKIRVALSSEGNCSRVYRPRTSPSPYNSLSMIVDISRPNNHLFYLGGNGSDFLSLETIDFQAIFKWDVGSGTGVVSSTIIMVPGKWYRIEASRIGQTGHLSVNDVRKPTASSPDSNTAPLGSTVLDVGDDPVLYIGGIPPDQKIDVVQTHQLSGCVTEVVLDGKPIGLWNYEALYGQCHGCMTSSLKLKEDDGFGFDGTGYTTVLTRRSFRPGAIYVVLSIRTISQNALLLYMGSPDQADFVSLELRGGRLVTKLDLGEGAAVGESSMRVNNNSWQFIVLAVAGNTSTLHLNDEKIISISAKPSPDGLSLSPSTKIYVGGLPFDFEMSRDVVTDSFRGCMRNFFLYRTILNLLQPGRSFGITRNCPAIKVENSLGLDGTGPVALQPVPLGRRADITLTFTTIQEDAVILAAGDLLDRRQKRDVNYDAVEVSYSILLVDGLLQVHINSGQGRLTLGSRKNDWKLNDGRPHTVLMQKNDKRIKVTVDDRFTRSGRLPGTNLYITARSPLYLGGVGDGVSVSRLVQSLPWFSGCIEHLVIMGEMMAFNNLTDSPSASVGHCGPLTIPPPRPTEAPSMIRPPVGGLVHPTGPSVQPCHVPVSPEYIPYGLRFGVTSESYAAVDILPAEVSKVFTMSIELRTTSESGLIFHMADRSERNFCALVVLKGFLLFTFSLGSGSVNVLTNAAIDDGSWHMVEITRNRKTGTIQVDGGSKQRIKTTAGGASRLSIVSPLYIGGLPNDSPSTDFGGEPSFQGCIRRFDLNHKRLDLPTIALATRGTSLCYTNTEPGAFFPGDSYVIQESGMLLLRELTIALEFKTSARDGVLFGLANPGNAYIVLELKNLAINLWSSNGQETFRVIFNDPPTTSLCDNQWHSIEVRVTLIQLALRVDGNDTIATHRMPGASGGRYSLFAGGIPDGFLHNTWVPFQGCMRKFTFNGVIQDFSRGEEIEGVIPDQCPHV